MAETKSESKFRDQLHKLKEDTKDIFTSLSVRSSKRQSYHGTDEVEPKHAVIPRESDGDVEPPAGGELVPVGDEESMSLWDQAYKNLRDGKETKELVMKYEAVLSKELEGKSK